MARAHPLVSISRQLCREVSQLEFGSPTTHVYNPLAYAQKPHEAYLQRYGCGKKRVLMLGMNPGPWGMAQTGIPFGEIPAVRDWMGIEEPVGKPEDEHPKRLIEGFDCPRSEVSGRRLWGLFAERFPTASDFFEEHFVVNFCPLVFMEESGRNRTPDKLPKKEMVSLFDACRRHLEKVCHELQPEIAIGVGAFAEVRLKEVLGEEVSIGRILHPSPASPAANRDWAGTAEKQLQELGVKL